jgi:hypothetical protein
MPEEDATLRLLRGSRARPPHRAGEDPFRSALYGASLEQFEQLLKAADAVGPAARPLPLFYALSQAGRAIVAARGEEPEIGGHGLAEDRQVPEPESLLHRRVARRAVRDGRDAFGAVSRAIGSPEPNLPVELGEIWVGLPNTYAVPQSFWSPHWRQVLEIFGQGAHPEGDGRTGVPIASFCGNPHHDEASTVVSSRYPSLPLGTALARKGDGSMGPGNWVAVLSWEGEHDFDLIAPTDRGVRSASASHHIVPTLASDTELLNPLMLWWMLLFGLSILARYNPSLWVEALQVDSSELAVPLEGLLDRALNAVPALVHHELLGV